jgi:thioredoxin 1
MSEPIIVTDDTFEEEVTLSSLPVLADFWAEWCPPCHVIAPILEEIAKEYKGRLKVAKLNVDDNPITTSRFGVMSIPTLILFKGGREAERLVGAMPKEKLVEKIKPHLK